ncbi:tripartite tricarboxylate transporter TctB family protein [Alkalihalobacillus oceani]|uniref:Tripartite tricarboxylate transporter TctB family protein n=1 Tax=Halalkalibacter oceani TaxID=1653776 RepID=A0A9X2DR29_9BACI|nr:tripartite tricarboxylate transporter TctB family protein [Halalkalibacter oceani]MCM3715394.1 tripartite tricarboxylate transporter TctB family protein [Halalkalibacter oceani]
MTKANHDVIISICVMGFAVFFFSLTFQFPTGNPQDMGPAFMPRAYAIMIMILGLLLFFKGLKSGPQAGKKGTKLILLTIGWLFIYIFFVPIIGFYIMTPLFLFVFLWIVRERRLIPLLAIPLFTTVLIFFFFKQLLNVPIPAGTLF